MGEKERLEREAVETLKRYLDADARYKNRLPTPGESLPVWTPTLEELEEVSRMGEEVDKARAEWIEALKRYIKARGMTHERDRT